MRSLLIVSAVFILSIILGMLFADITENTAQNFVNQTFQQFKFVGNLKHYELFAFIFANNSLKAFASMILGIGLGIVPVLFVALNGITIGMVVVIVGGKMGILSILALLAPHGILEIPALLLSSSYGLDLGVATFKRLKGEEIDLNLVLLNCLKRFAKIPLPMLLIAAFIETYITPIIAGA